MAGKTICSACEYSHCLHYSSPACQATASHPSFPSRQCQTQSSFNVSLLTGVEPSRAQVTQTHCSALRYNSMLQKYFLPNNSPWPLHSLTRAGLRLLMSDMKSLL